MDARQSAPPPFQRPPEDRHNPNHQPQPQPYAGYPPPNAQPQQPLHVPFSPDPYAASRRDPFLPTSAQHVRRSSQGIHNGENGPQAQTQQHGGWTHAARPNNGLHYGAHHHAHAGPPPPPSMATSNNPPGPSPYQYDPSRRGSLSGSNPPTPYGGRTPAFTSSFSSQANWDSPAAPSHDTPAPPSFARPQMLPPSSPQQQYASQAPRPPYASAFGGNRELPGLGPLHRPGSSMSISSLIGGGDAGAPAQTPQSQTSPPTNAQPAAGHSMQPPSPRRALPSGARPDFAPFRRQPSPDRSMYGGNTSRASDGQGFAAASPTRSYSNHGSPEQGRQSLPPSNQPYKLFGQRFYAPAANDGPAQEPRQPPSAVPPRPNSQPLGDQGRSTYDDLAGRRSAYGPPEERRRTLGESHHSRPNAAELLATAGHGATNRDRPNTVHPVSQSGFSPPRTQQMVPTPNEPQRSLWRQSAPSTAEGRREEPVMSQRPYATYPSPAHAAPRYDGPSGEDMARQRSVDRLNNRVVEQYHAPPTSDPNSIDRHKTEPLARSLSSSGNGYPGRSMYDYPRRMGEEMQLSKSHIGFGLEASRRTGRASPLPQAVQGAQAQPLSIGKDPGIKSEFGRMFSGLGSGLGSSTPSRGSPMPQNGQGSFSNDPDSSDVLRLQRVNSQQGRKTKRVKDEDTFDADSNDGRGTPSGGRGGKRSKHNHPGHHHHAAHHHHHHHHHHAKGDDDAPHSNTSTPLNGRQNSLPQTGPGQPVHHHHHIQGTPHHHHHHHAPRGNLQAPPIVAKATVKVHDVQPVLEEASKFARRHLGSQLYEPIAKLPKPNSPLDDQFGYASKPKRLPRFEANPINCTFTIRVPRFFLKPRQRQHIVLERHLWGARVYRDDSDPLAAAIHSGWIRGEWDDTVDVTMLDPRITAPNDPADAEETLTKIPAAPVTPPADMDLQIEILILPQLQEYSATVEYGISSKKGKAHEGLSFMINKIRWVEEGFGSRGQERTAAALKRRLDASASLLALKSGFDDAHRMSGMARLHA